MNLGVLLIAKRKGVIESVSESLDRIEKTDFRITNRLVTTVLKLAGEY